MEIIEKPFESYKYNKQTKTIFKTINDKNITILNYDDTPSSRIFRTQRNNE